MTDQVKNPKHYQLMGGVEVIQVIAGSMTKESFFGYCLGNKLKYRLRAGKKDNIEQEIGKADFYSDLYEQYKHLCKTTQKTDCDKCKVKLKKQQCNNLKVAL